MAESAGELPAEIRAMSFEAAMGELEEIVQRLESGQVALEESIEIYSRGALLKQHCESRLRTATEKVEKIVADADGRAIGSEAAELG